MSKLIGLLLPFFASMYLIPFYFGFPLVIPLLCLFLTFCDLKPKWKSGEIFLVLFLVGSSLLIFLHSIDKAISFMVIAGCLFIALNYRDRLSNFSLSLAFCLHIIFALISFISLFFLGYDYIPEQIYGESRHLVHVNEFVSYRVSGIYREPSNFAVAMLLLAMWGHQLQPSKLQHFQCLCFLGLSILTYSSVSILAMVYLFLKYGGTIFRAKSLPLFIILAPVLTLLAIPAVWFFIDKVILYQSRGLDDASRFQILSSFSDFGAGFSWVFGASPKMLDDYVVYDLGPLLSPFLIYGAFGLIAIILFIRYAGFSMRLLILALTKVSPTNLLLWIVIINKDKRK